MKMICATLWTIALQILLAIAVGEADRRRVATQRLHQTKQSLE